METSQIAAVSPAKGEKELNLQKILGLLLAYWWLYLVLILVSLSCGYLYLRYSTSQYKITAKILVKDNKKGGGASGMAVFEELGLLGGQNSVDNEVELLKSRTLMENTVSAIQLNARYYVEGNIKQTEIFKEKAPFKLDLVEINEDSLQQAAHILFTPVDTNNFRLTYNNAEKVYKYNETISFPFAKLRLVGSQIKKNSRNEVIQIVINRLDNVVSEFQQKLNVSVTSKTVSTIDLALDDAVPERGEVLLNTLIRIYNVMNTEDKNRVADSTITFIDNRLVFVTRELGNVEQNIEQFRKRNQLTDISAQGKLLLENSSEYFKELSKTEVQISIVQSLENYLNNEQNTSRTIPAGLVIEDPTFASMIEKYNSLQLERDRQMQTTTESNPVVQRLLIQISNLKNDIIANLGTIKRSMEITRAQLKNRTTSFETQIQEVPRKERAFLEISRQQAIKQELYLYLLKKREETAVSKAANIDNARIVDSAKAQRAPFTPKRQLIYLAALVVGIVLPSAFIYAGTLMNNKVETKQDITSVSSAPIVGEIGRSPYTANLVVKEHPRHPISEQLRLLRTNLDYMFPSGNKGRVILVTSSMSGEGKSFLSLNLAAMLSLGGKRVALLEFDLRKPKLSKYLGVNDNEGLSTYLIKKNTDVDTLTKLVTGMDSLYFLGSGPIPPNPAELINSEQTKELFAALKARFDQIIVDVPPIGIVTDGLLLSSYSDINLYVIRQNYTYKNQLELVEEMYQQKKLTNLGIIVNDIKKQKGYGYGYGSGYGYGYEAE